MRTLRRCLNIRASLRVLWLLGLLLPSQAAAQSYNQILPWDYSVGDPSVFSAYLNGQLQLTGGITGTSVAAQAAAGGSVLGFSKDILKASASGSGYLTGDTYATVDIAIFGVSKQHKDSPAFFTGDIYKEEFDQVVAKATFPVGPFPITVTIGARGAVGLTYGVGLTHGSASATLLPFARAGIYGTAALDFDFVAVGVGANLTLIDFTVPLTAGAHLTPNYFTEPPSWGVKWDFDVSTKTTLLSGNLYLFAKVDFGFLYKKEWDFTIFSWPGFKTNQTLFNDAGWTSIGVFLPEAASLMPSSVVAGSGDLQLAINGLGFSPADSPTVSWDGIPLTLQNVTSTQATVVVPSSYLSVAGQHAVTVATPGPLGGTSNPLPFHVVLGAPVLTQISPGAVTAGGNEFILTVNGASLIPGSTVLWNSTPLSTTHVSDSQLTAVVSAQNILNVGAALISVHYPGTGSQTSNTLTLPVFNPNQPIVTRTFPSSAFPGSNDVTMHVVGTGFVAGSIVDWNGTSLTSTYVSATQLDAQVPASLLAIKSVAQVGVINPSSAPSNTIAFDIAPITYTAVPIPLPPGAGVGGQAVAVNSSGLVAVQPADNSHDPYLWSEAKGIITLPPFSRPPCGVTSITINGMNDLGQIVGTDLSCIFDSFGDAIPVFTGFLYSDGVISLLPLQTASGVNDSTAIVGLPQQNQPGPPVFQHGQLGFLPLPPSFELNANSNFKINNSGQVIGSLGSNSGPNNGCVGSSSFRTFSWVNGVIATELPLLPSMACSFDLGLNNFGTAIGWTSGPQNQPYQEFGWILKKGTIGMFPSIGTALNDNEDILSGSNLFSNGHVYDLNTLLTNPTAGFVVGLAIANNGLMAGTVHPSNGPIGPVLLKPNGSAQSLSYWNGSLLITAPVTGVQPSTVLVETDNFQTTVNGSNFVSGAVVYWNGSPLNTTFSSSSSLIASVPATFLASTGYATITAVNPGGGLSNGFVIAILNPTPTLNMVSPVQAVAGSAGFTLSVSGNSFQPGSQIYWNQVPLNGTYVSSSQLSVVVPGSLLATPSNAAVTVVNPAPGGGASTPTIVRVIPPAPVANDTNPQAVEVGSPGVVLTVSGSGFDSTSIVWWNNTQLPTTLVSPLMLQAQVPAALLTDAGTAAVTVIDTVPGAWPSRRLHFVVNNPTPQATTLSPTTVQAGHGDLMITVAGDGFVPGCQVYLDGRPIATSYVSRSQLTAVVPAANLVVTQASQVTIVNPEPNDAGLTGALTLTITDPPGVQDVNPAMARVGNAAILATVRGQGFTSQSTVTWNGAALSTSFVSANQLTAFIPAQNFASPGTYTIRVSQVAAGGGQSSAVAFTVYDTIPRPQIAGLTPSETAAGSPAVEILITGTGFLSTTAALWNGAARPSAFLSPQQMLLHVDAGDVAIAGHASIQLQNPADAVTGSGGLSNSVTFRVFDGSEAVTTDYTSVNAFMTAVTSVTTRGFNGILAAGQSTASFNPLNVYGITISTPTPNTFVNVTTSSHYPSVSYPADFIVDSSNPSINNSVVISFASPVYAVGLNYGGLFGSGPHQITLSNGHVFRQPATVPIGQTEFAGFVSNEPITSLTLETDNNSWVVLNLLLGTPKPPAPMSQIIANPLALNIGAAKSGPAIPFLSDGQDVSVSFSGASAAWTASTSTPWLQLTNASGTGAGRFTVKAVNPNDVIGTSTSLSGTIVVSAPTLGSSVTLAVTLSVKATGLTDAPFGAFDTPTSGSTGLAGSFAVTGWALDDIGIDHVEIWRDPVAGETTPTYEGAGLGNGKIFIANPLFISGARPDIETAHSTYPFANRAGWGYLLLSWGLWQQGNGPYTLYAFAYDKEGHAVSLGSKSIVVDNAHATKPFGGLDTPIYGDVVSGGFWNYGWALTPNPNAKDPRSCVISNGSVQVAIDSGPLVNVKYGDLRPDIAAAFPGFSNGSSAGGSYYIDTSTLTNGPHQIGWLVTDSCGRQDGIGSRFFTVLNGGMTGPTAVSSGNVVSATIPLTRAR